MSSSQKADERYVLFKIKLETAENLLHSLFYYKNLLEAHGHRLTGAYPRFIDELHGLLQRERERKKYA